MNHIFLHCSLTFGLWHKPFRLVNLDQVPPRSIFNMMTMRPSHIRDREALLEARFFGKLLISH